MTKKIIPLSSWVSAQTASELLSDKLGRPVSPEYIRKLARRKRNPVKTQRISNRLLYLKSDILAVSIKAKQRRA